MEIPKISEWNLMESISTANAFSYEPK
jgi:hypothetical protein